MKTDIPERIEELVRRTEAVSDTKARELAVELVSAVMELHAEALSRIVEFAQQAQDPAKLVEAMAADEFVSAVLALHDVHPYRLDTRLERVMEKLRDELRAGEMDIELLDWTPQVVRVRLLGGTPARRAAARHWIQSTVYEAAPRIEDVVIEGTEENAGFVPLESLLATRGAA